MRGSVPGPRGGGRGGAHRWLTLRCSARPPQPRSSSTRRPSARASPRRSSTRACAPSRPPAAAAPPPPRPARMVSGGGAKPWRQKGTGRARAGSSRSPIWTGGGTVFGPQPRSYTFKVNRKEQRAALRSALSLHAERGSLAILDAGAFSAPKTRQALELLEDWGRRSAASAHARGARPREEGDAALSFRNLARVAVLTPENVGVTDLLGAASLRRLRARARGAGGPHRRATAAAPREEARPDGRHPGDHPPGRLGEELRARRPPTATPSASTPTPTRPRSARPSRRCSTSTW